MDEVIRRMGIRVKRSRSLGGYAYATRPLRLERTDTDSTYTFGIAHT